MVLVIGSVSPLPNMQVMVANPIRISNTRLSQSELPSLKRINILLPSFFAFVRPHVPHLLVRCERVASTVLKISPVYACVGARAYVCVCVRAWVRVRMCACARVCVCVRACARVRARVYLYCSAHLHFNHAESANEYREYQQEGRGWQEWS